jgi:hypothetical protein
MDDMKAEAKRKRGQEGSIFPGDIIMSKSYRGLFERLEDDVGGSWAATNCTRVMRKAEPLFVISSGKFLRGLNTIYVLTSQDMGWTWTE